MQTPPPPGVTSSEKPSQRAHPPNRITAHPIPDSATPCCYLTVRSRSLEIGTAALTPNL